MTLTRWSPYQNWLSWQEEMDRVFNALTPFTGLASMLPTRSGQSSSLPTFALPVDVQDTDDGYVIRATVAGFTPEEVEATYTNGLLTISAKHEQETTTEEGGYVLRERSTGNLYRQISLPGEVNADGIKASIENGILTLQVPKVAPKPVKIAVAPEQKQLAEAKK